MLSRREILIGAAAVAAAANIPSLPITAAPAEIIPSWVVGSPGEFDWQHVVAKTQREALRFFAEECGDYEEECIHFDYQAGCDCCEAIGAYEAQRVPIWDGKKDVSCGDWLRANMGSICSRCGYETYREEGGHAVGDEAVCSECMTLPDWDIVDPERAAELRAELVDT